MSVRGRSVTLPQLTSGRGVLALRRLARPAVVLLCLAGLAACQPSPDQQLNDARASIARGEPYAAVVALKSLLAQDENNATLRLELGRALYMGGNASTAEVELRKALQFGAPREQVVPLLARSLSLAGKHRQLLDELASERLSEPAAQAELLVILAQSHAALRQQPQVRERLAQARELVPHHVGAAVFDARLQADAGDVAGALKQAQAIVQRAPDAAEAWHLQGDLLSLGQGDIEQAEAAYRKAVELRPTFVPAHSALIGMAILRRDVEAARARLEALDRLMPNQPHTAFFAAQVALLAGEVDRARQLSQALLRGAPDNARVLHVAGSAELQADSLPLAASLFQKALQFEPEQQASRLLLAETYIRMSNPDFALTALRPLLEGSTTLARAHRLAGRAHMLAGRWGQAQLAYARALELDPQSRSVQTELASSRLRAGQVERGLQELQVLSASGDDSEADLPLISALMQKGDHDAALRAVEVLENKQPGTAMASHLRGRVLLEKGDRQGARQAFQQALARDKAYFQATVALFEMAMREGRNGEAEQLLTAAAEARPQDPAPLIALARIKSATGAPREAVDELYQRAVRLQPDDPGVRAALIRHRLDGRAFRAALDDARSARSALPNDPAIMELLGRAELLNGNTQQALQAFSQWSQRVAGSPQPWLRIAEAHRIAGNNEQAIQALERAATLAPDAPESMTEIALTMAELTQPARAVRLARGLQQARPRHAAGYMAEGQVSLRQRRWDDAIDAFRRGIAAVPGSTDLATRMYSALVAARRQPDADRHAEQWIRQHPADAQFLFFLGNVELQAGRTQAAEQRFRAVLALQPANAFAMNNLAWLMAGSKQAGAADLARRAVELLPGNSVALDTLALALTAEGRPKEAVEPIRRAVGLAPTNHDLRLHLAKVLIAAGDKAGAADELQRLAQLGTNYPRQPEVKALQAQL